MHRFLLSALMGLVGCTQLLGDDFTVGDPGTGGGASSGGGPGSGGAGAGGQAAGGAGGTGGTMPMVDVQWQERVGGQGEQLLRQMAVDGADQVGLVGTFNGAIALDSTYTAASSVSDGFIAKTDASGQVLWSRQVPGQGSRFVRPESATFGDMGSMFITGTFEGTTDFGSGPFSSIGNADAFIVKYDANGGFDWATVIGSSNGSDRGVAVATSSNRLFAVGEWVSDITIGNTNHTSGAARNIYLASFGFGGSSLLSETWPSQGSHFVADVATDAAGEVIIVGTYDFVANFGGGDLSPSGSDDAMYVAKFTPTLVHQWSRSFSSSSGTIEPSRVCTQGSSIAVVGRYGGPIDFGGGAVPHTANDDAFALILDGAGNYVQAVTLNAAADEGFGDCAFLPGSRLAVMGSFGSVVDTGMGPLSPDGDNDHLFLIYEAGSSTPTFARQLRGDGSVLQPHIEATTDGGVILGSSPDGSHSFGGMVLPGTVGTDFAYAKLR